MNQTDHQDQAYQELIKNLYMTLQREADSFQPENYQELQRAITGGTRVNTWLSIGSKTKDASYNDAGDKINHLLEPIVEKLISKEFMDELSADVVSYDRFMTDFIKLLQVTMTKSHHKLKTVETEPKLPDFMQDDYLQVTEQNQTQSNQLSETISKVIEPFIQFKLGNTPDLYKDTTGAYTDAVRDLVFIIGDKPIHSYSFDDAQEFRNTLRKLPPKRNRQKFNGLMLKELLALDHKKVLASTTINKKLTALKGLFEWLINTNKITHNPFTLVKQIVSKQSYSDFTKDDLIKIFASDIYNRDSSYANRKTTHVGMWWLSPMMLFTGARPGELLQLKIIDVKTKDGNWYFDLEDEDKSKQVKTEAARRIVPIHDSLIELGFLEYIREAKKLGFERVLQTFPLVIGKPSKKASQWFGETYREKYLDPKWKDQNKTLYSFRSTHITNSINAGVQLERLQNYVGHETSQMGATKHYWRGNNIDELADAVNKVQFEGVDLGHIVGGWKMYMQN